ncbi:predicted protein [Sclerotinia sclerotiorum 1980 UF-70]|uniref:Uncharacterized protein n=1 Tax=Sclerotinia sclerotiorum (strain ATCC 18683 / 1980 / Ss-1) TaxID=665079 RepID=A7F9D0_SCLS1|nr:predicted protein [Sclerotinia sclerotiorum 1980 UF-70]EDO00341.1 predicted protein [Sclerotinia sclerotiorum 1980 UF-70]
MVLPLQGRASYMPRLWCYIVDNVQAKCRKIIAASAPLGEAAKMVMQAIGKKLAKSLSITQDDISTDRNKPLQM